MNIFPFELRLYNFVFGIVGLPPPPRFSPWQPPSVDPHLAEFSYTRPPSPSSPAATDSLFSNRRRLHLLPVSRHFHFSGSPPLPAVRHVLSLSLKPQFELRPPSSAVTVAFRFWPPSSSDSGSCSSPL
ncbi:hypothetical protein PIB30_044861 [Stylosanthes scabra]|uniref:Uncharacterized protein n=1 Tax=Stylosanthes scabra TaxID=79078 RepID=A0ABU6QFJ0_9FABA|nr:hypothetical protein [Stylosanthes scabra]